MLPHAIQVIQVRHEGDVLRLNLVRRPTTPALIVVDEPEVILQSVEVGKQVAMVEIGSAVEDDNRFSIADRSDIKRRLINLYLALHSTFGFDSITRTSFCSYFSGSGENVRSSAGCCAKAETVNRRRSNAGIVFIGVSLIVEIVV